MTRSFVDENVWNGLNVKAPIMHFGEASVLAAVDQSDAVPKLTFTLAERPKTESGSLSDQKYVVSVDPGIGLYNDDLNTLHFPFMPELNDFFGRNAYYRSALLKSRQARSVSSYPGPQTTSPSTLLLRRASSQPCSSPRA